MGIPDPTPDLDASDVGARHGSTGARSNVKGFGCRVHMVKYVTAWWFGTIEF